MKLPITRNTPSWEEHLKLPPKEGIHNQGQLTQFPQWFGAVWGRRGRGPPSGARHAGELPAAMGPSVPVLSGTQAQDMWAAEPLKCGQGDL